MSEERHVINLILREILSEVRKKKHSLIAADRGVALSCFSVRKWNYSLSAALRGTNGLARVKGLQREDRDVFSVRGPDCDFCPVFTTASRRSMAAHRPLFQRKTERPEELLTAGVWMLLSPQCFTCASKRAITRKWYTLAVFFPQEYVPLSPSVLWFFLSTLSFVPSSSDFTPPSSHPLFPHRPPLAHIASENLWNSLKLKCAWCPALHRGPGTENKCDSLFRVYCFLSAQVSIDYLLLCTHIYCCCTISHPCASVLQHSTPMLVFPLLSLRPFASYKHTMYVCAI